PGRPPHRARPHDSTVRRQLRHVRNLHRSRLGLRCAAAARRARARGRPRRLVARVRGHARRQCRLPFRPRGGRPPMTDTTDTSSASADRARTASLSRTTRESSVELSLDLDGTGQVDVSTTVPFFAHTLTALRTNATFAL